MDDDFDELLFYPSSEGQVHSSTTRSPFDECAALPYRIRENEMLGDSDTGRRSNSPFRELCSTELDEKPIPPDVNVLLPLLPSPRESVIAQIESVFEHQVDVLLAKQGSLFVTLKARSKKSIGTVQSTTPNCKNRVYHFPGKSAEEAWRYTVIMRLLEMIHEALSNNVVVTKRDMYYRDPALFSNQEVVNRYIDELAHTFNVSRSCLNVAATAKGLVVGAYWLKKASGSCVTGWSEKEGQLITGLSGDESIDISRVKWILVVEKEATFRSLVESPFWQQISREGMVITAKGYPDLFTRAFLRFVCSPSSQNGYMSRPVYGLVDFDPDGIGILSTYKRGSKRLAHETAELSCPTMHWIGLKSGDILSSTDTHQVQGLLKLSGRDRRRASRMLMREPLDENGEEPVWRREVQVMLMLNIKAEIQLLDARKGGMGSWLDAHMNLHG